ncbi:hypothetical protein EV359DRAFT_36897 [Lentinula novae-zelandiae]|nr:hypothetical protein EV359DRAFT_36897 [Lentinula novae-zelandiae]
MLIRHLFQLLNEQPRLLETLTYEQISRFIRLTIALKNDIIAAQPSEHDPSSPPGRLPVYQCNFLSQICDIPQQYINTCWIAVSSIVWGHLEDESERYNDKDFEAWHVGDEFGLSGQTLWPPTHQCFQCPSTSLLREKDGLFSVTLFTLRNGARATYATYLTCSVQYHPNYYVQHGRRLYYEAVPSVLEVTKHVYVERELAALFLGQMLMSWTSATNAAHMYNTILASTEIPTNTLGQRSTSKLAQEHVWDAVIILSLLEYFGRSGRLLDVPHIYDQSHRFQEAMHFRNTLIAEGGQELDHHYCNRCMRVLMVNGVPCMSKIHALVVDGICIGRPCCAYQGEACKKPLPSNKHRFCIDHTPEALVCAVTSCRAGVETGFLTCHDRFHRQLETNRKERQKSMFYLSQVHHRHGISNPSDSIDPTDIADDVELADGPEEPQKSTTFAVDCPDKEEINPKLRAMFGRNRTHAEVVMHRPCGIMIRRKTCYKAETLSHITDSFHWLDNHGLLPDVSFYDNNCRLYRYLRAHDDPLLGKLALPVDVFHWKSKHKKSDIDCSYHCSPYSFPELRINEHGQWYFNSSIAEQNNIWLGGYHSMLREMGHVKYDYFLDEMILRWNRMTLAKLSSFSPSELPR